MKTPAILHITVTHLCNCRCKYCFEKDHTDVIDSEEENRQIDLLKKFCDTFDKDKYSTFNILFWGGEPMMRYDFVRRIILATKDYYFVNYIVYTNGTLKNKWNELINEEFFDEIKERFAARVSFDGEPQHTDLRGVSSENAIQLCYDLKKRGARFFTRSTLSFDYVGHLPDMWESFKKEHLKDYDFTYYPIFDTTIDDDTNYDKFVEALKEMTRREFDFYSEHKHVVCEWFMKENIRPDIKCRNCMAKNFACMNKDGNFYPCYGCESFPWADKIVIGNTKKANTLEDILCTGNFGEENEECKNCDAVFCFTCHAANIPFPKDFEEFKSLWHKNRNAKHKRCRFYKAVGRMYRLFWKAVELNDKSLIDTFE